MINTFEEKYKKAVKSNKNWWVDLKPVLTICGEDTKSMVGNLRAQFNDLRFNSRINKLLNDNPKLSFIREHVQPLYSKFESLERSFDSVDHRLREEDTTSQCIPDELESLYRNWTMKWITTEESQRILWEVTRSYKKVYNHLSNRFKKEILKISEKMENFKGAADSVRNKIRDLRSNDNPQRYLEQIKTVVKKLDEKYLVKMISSFGFAKQNLTIFFKERLCLLRLLMNDNISFIPKRRVSAKHDEKASSQ